MDTLRVTRPHRIGLFSTAFSAVILISGFLVAMGSSSYDPTRYIAGTLIIAGIIGVLSSYLLVRMYFWAFHPQVKIAEVPKPVPARGYEDYSLEPIANNSKPVSDGKNLNGIGGWLGFVVLGLIAAPLYGLVSVVQQISAIKDMSKLGPTFEILIMTETAGMILISIIAPVYLFRCMMKHSVVFPKRYIQWLVSVLAFLFLDHLAVYLIFKQYIDQGKFTLFDRESTNSIARAIGAAVIWIPYMFISKRVKATFNGNKFNADDLRKSEPVLDPNRYRSADFRNNL